MGVKEDLVENNKGKGLKWREKTAMLNNLEGVCVVDKGKRKKLYLLLKRLYEDVCIGGIETSMYS